MYKKITVLLIDENFIDKFVSKKIFEGLGVKDVIILTQYAHAISYLLNEKPLPNYVFIDVNIPRRDGFEFYRKVKKLDISLVDTKFFFLSNSLNPEDKLKAEILGVDFIDKPLSVEKIKKIGII